MIRRHYRKGEKLDVAGLNQIIVLLDRSETEITEVGWNQWRAGLVGPPHKHDDKEQLFYITSGEGIVTVGKDEFQVKPGNLIYVPAGVVHRSTTTSDEPLTYILFNVFLNPEKEGHATFAEHIEKVKQIRKQQAETGKPLEGETLSDKKGKYFANVFQAPEFDFGSNSTLLLLDRPQTCGFEMVVVKWSPGSKGVLVAHKEKEQTFFILKGSGWITVAEERQPVQAGEIIFIPRNTPHTTEAGEKELDYLCLNCYVGDTADKSFREMYDRVAPGRIARWKARDTSVGD